MLDFSQCVPEETVLVEENGVEWLFINKMQDGRILLKLVLSDNYFSAFSPYTIRRMIIKPTENPTDLDPSTLAPGDTLVTPYANLRTHLGMSGGTYLGMCGEYMLVRENIGLRVARVDSVTPSEWKKWKKQGGDHD